MSVAVKIDVSRDPVLRDVKARLHDIYGERIKRVVLYGSRARGDHRRDLDYDIAVFLRDYDGAWSETATVADLGYELLTERNADVSIKLFRLVDWRIDTLFMRHLRSDGVEI